jgi:hypothetical protein
MKAVWVNHDTAFFLGTGGQAMFAYMDNPTTLYNGNEANIGSNLAPDGEGSQGCWLTATNLLGCGSMPTPQIYPLGSSITFIAASGGFMTNGRYVAIRASDKQLIGYMLLSYSLVAGSVFDIVTPEPVNDVSYNGNYICIVGVSGQLYCSASYAMLPGVEVPWQPLGIALTSINVGTTGTLIGLDSKMTLVVTPDCMKPFWIQPSTYVFKQVSMIDGNSVWGITETNQIIYSASLKYYLLRYSKSTSSNGITFGDGLLSRIPHAANDHNPIILEKQ